MNLDRNSFEPLYYQLKEIISEKVKNGEYPVDSLIPSESEFCKMYNISRITVRKAILDLVQEGALYRGKGLGTFVMKPAKAAKLEGVQGFTELMLRLNQRPSAKVLDIKVKKATAHISEKLGISKDEQVIVIKRLRSSDDEPLFIELLYLPYSRVAGLEKEDLEKSIYGILKEKYGIRITRVVETYEPVILDEFESKMLKAKSNGLGMLSERLGYTKGNDVIEFSMHIFSGDRCKFSVERSEK